MARRVLICAYCFHPDVGGSETAAMNLARGLAERGYDITVVTATTAADRGDAALPFHVIRRPGALKLLRLFEQADLVWHNHVSLRLLWPIVFIRKPIVFVHHCLIPTNTGPTDTQPGGSPFERLKHMACRLGHNAFVSEAYRRAVDLPGSVIYNAYDEVNFHAWPDVVRDRDVVFLGRLVWQKGVDLLIDALALLAAKRTRLRATIIGWGPREQALKAQVSAHGLGELVEFTGALCGEELSRTLARHRVMAMPSREFEGLPISAIEALACGCVVVGSNCGGLPEAIGPAGVVVRQESAAELATALEQLVTDTALYENCKAHIPQHLKLFSNAAVLETCEQLMRKAAAEVGWPHGTLFEQRVPRRGRPR